MFNVLLYIRIIMGKGVGQKCSPVFRRNWITSAHFKPMFPLSRPEITKNLSFSDAFRGDKKGTLARNGLNGLKSRVIIPFH